MSLFDPDLPDGIYIGLSAAAYFGQETRGSSDWSTISRRKHGWWWQSVYNTRKRVIELLAHLASGNATHCVLCEGIGAYEARYIIEPNKADFPGVLVTVEDMKRELTKHGFGAWPGQWKARDFAIACQFHLPQAPCWPNIVEDFELKRGGKTPISAEEDFHLRFLWEMATGDFPGNDPIKRLLTADAPVLAEVSVLSTIDGIRRRWRFDRMFPRLDMDLKTLANWTGQPLHYAAGSQLARYRWAIQREDYWIGRSEMYRMLVERGEAAISGGTIEQRKWLLTWPDEHPVWDWLWLIYQRPDSSGIAPVLMPVWEDSFDPATGRPSFLRQLGGYELANSIAFYREMVEKFGLDRPWGHVEPLRYTQQAKGREHLIVLPPWIGHETPMEDDAYV